MQLGMKERNIFLVSSPIYAISKNNGYNKRRSLSASASTLISSVSRKIGPHSSKSQTAMKSPCVILRVRVVRPRPSSVCVCVASRCEEVVQGWEAVFDGQGDQVA